MAAYAALVSVMQIIQQLENHPRPPVSLDKKQVESLTEKVTFLQEFLEGYAPTGKNEGDGLESRILDVAYAAEDVIESHIVGSIHAQGPILHGDEIGVLQKIQRIIWDYTHKIRNFTKSWGDDHVKFGQLLQKVIEDMDIIKIEVMETKEEMGVQHQLQRKSTSPSGGQTSSSSMQKQNTTMVGFGDVFLELLDKLTRGGLDRQIIPIVGMGGIGKTTLARNVYEHALIREHFDILAWITISQDYDALKILESIIISQENKHDWFFYEKNEKNMGESLYQNLFGRRYLIVMDDMWSIEAWERIKFFFPDNKNGSRIVVTTRLSNLARQLNNFYCIRMRFLDFNESWNLFSKIVFTREDYPFEMVEIGKKIVKNCRGLPLSIVVVGGFLAKSRYMREHWEHIEENLSSFVNSDNDELCLKILLLSYNQLPIHLRSCFLYMGMFNEDSEVPISKLVKLLVAEGFLKPINGKDLEDVAKEYLNDVVDRNLIFIVKSREKCVKIHDLLRDLCWREAEKERFYTVITQHSITIPHDHRRFIFPRASLQKLYGASHLFPLARSITSYNKGVYTSTDHRLLRISGTCDNELLVDDYFHENKFQLVNLRYLLANPRWDSKFATSFHLLWSLQTFIIQGYSDRSFTLPAEIWNMPQLRHIQVTDYLLLPDPPAWNGLDNIVLENLRTLMRVKNFKCDGEVVKRIPNTKELELTYVGPFEERCLNNIGHLHKLKFFSCRSKVDPRLDGIDFLQNLSFPLSLKKLVLETSQVHWENILEKIGRLPLLQKLSISGGFFTTRAWETIEGQFSRLKFLEVVGCGYLEHWKSECSHFPRLEHLVLCGLESLYEIPSGIGEIPTLLSIELSYCSKSSTISSKRIQEEHEELYGGEEVALRVRVKLNREEYKELQHLASPNFELVIC